jgi:hypothetical protein
MACTFNGEWLFSQPDGTFNDPCLGLVAEPNSDINVRRGPRYQIIEREPDNADVELLLLTPHRV